jgi:hypothetical protein
VSRLMDQKVRRTGWHGRMDTLWLRCEPTATHPVTPSQPGATGLSDASQDAQQE